MKKVKKLIMTKGLPASGKSTWAKKQVDEHGFKRINKDDLRAMIDNGKHSKGNEKAIIAVRNLMIADFLTHGHSVIIDDTNFHPMHENTLKALAEEHGAEFHIEDFTHVPVEECIERDRKRANYVGEIVIRRMYREYLKSASPVEPLIKHNPDLPNCIIVDVDGTIANNTGVRGWFEFDKVYEDAIKPEVLACIDAFCSKFQPHVFIFSGRENTGKCLDETRRWLVEKVFPLYTDFAFGSTLTLRENIRPLILRNEKDMREDSIIKREMYEEHIKEKFNVLAVFDDRNQVVDMWRSLGFTVFQVAAGDF